ncbi:MAG: haloacid dehalogenase [Rhodospirillales bacterium]|nr:haloacid dehalogenase [Rhodospirillales bacterium]MCB9997082.1 haloacid dehalogenase [Rhodospirillales bacterium]
MRRSEAVPDNIKGLIWDLDNTLYRFDHDFVQACHIAAARAALKGGVPMNMEQAVAYSERSYLERGHSYFLFVENFEVNELSIHLDFHDFIDETIIKKSKDLADLFVRSGLQHILVTHGSRRWAHKALLHLGLDRFFPPERIIPAEEIDFARKHASRVPFEKALQILDLPEAHVAVVEDMADNLLIPHEMGLSTILVHYGRVPDPMPDHIDYAYNNAAEFLKQSL